MILVVGGYGQVGARVSKNLVNVIVAGRNQSQADEFIAENNIEGISRRFDTSNLDDHDFKDVDTIVMCVESNNIDVLKYCIKLKINYIDISPTTSVLEEIESYREEIDRAGIKVIIGVGIAPGVSNLLAKKAVHEMDEVHEIDSYVMLGIGEEHGRNAVTWLLQNIYSKNPEIQSFTNTKKVPLLRSKRNKKIKTNQIFTRIDMADSMIMGKLNPSAIARTWFAYDVNLVTRAVCFMKRLGFFHSINQPDLNKRKAAQQKMARLLNKEMRLAKVLHIGTDAYSIQIHVCGMKNHEKVEKTYVTYGYCNSNLTAYVAAETTKRIMDFENGLHYLEEVLDISELDIMVY